jgi:hypothetical protein
MMILRHVLGVFGVVVWQAGNETRCAHVGLVWGGGDAAADGGGDDDDDEKKIVTR